LGAIFLPILFISFFREVEGYLFLPFRGGNKRAVPNIALEGREYIILVPSLLGEGIKELFPISPLRGGNTSS
jgi:hypothetical protein